MPEVKDAQVAANKGVTPDATEASKTADSAATAQDAAKIPDGAKAEPQDAAKADVTKADEAGEARHRRGGGYRQA